MALNGVVVALLGTNEKERKGKRRKGKETGGTEPPSKKGREEKEIEGTDP